MLTSKKFASSCRTIPASLSSNCTVDNKKPKTKKCAVCKEPFPVFRSMQKVCGQACAQKSAELKRLKEAAKREQEERKKTRAQREALKSRQQWLKEAQAAVNRYVRIRDRHFECCSCAKGPAWNGQWHASHFKSVGSNSALRFHLWNIHKGCSVCNNWLSGNIGDYRQKLIQRIGIEKVEWLERAPKSRTYGIEYLRRIKMIFTKRANRMTK